MVADEVRALATRSQQSTTEEQSHVSKSVVQSVRNISQLAEDVERGSNQTSAAAKKLAQIAEHTHELVDRFKV